MPGEKTKKQKQGVGERGVGGKRKKAELEKSEKCHRNGVKTLSGEPSWLSSRGYYAMKR